MNPHIVQKWLKSLKKGKYKQEKRVLKGSGNYFSVIGVLLDITKDITRGKWHGNWFLPSSEKFTKGGNQSCYSMPVFAAKKLGFRHLKNDYPLGHGLKSSNIETLNEQYNFDELTEVIKTEYLT